MNNEILVKSIREMCKLNNITPSQLENELNFGAGLISRWTKSSPAIDKIVAIADYFNVSIDELIGRVIKEECDFLTSLVNLTQNDIIEWKQIEDDSKIRDAMFTVPWDIMHGYMAKYNNSNIFLCMYEGTRSSKKKFKKYYLFIQANQDSALVLQEDISQEQLETFWKYVFENCSMSPDELKANKIKNEIVNKSKELNSKTFQQHNSIKNKEDNQQILNKLNTPEIKKLISVFSDPKMNETINSIQQIVSLYNNK